MLQNFCSGYGAYHTDNPKSPNPRPYTTVTLDDIKAMVHNPSRQAKEEAQWVIFSTELTRNLAQQKAKGRYFAVWLDIDNDTELSAILAILAGLGCDYIVYSSRSSTDTLKKWRVIIPLATPATAQEVGRLSEVINDKFEQAGVIPDRANQTANQVCYLPNRGDFYDYRIADNAAPLDWQTALSVELNAKEQQANEAKKALMASMERSRDKAAERVQTDSLSPVDTYNAEYSIIDCLAFYGYRKHGERWVSPNSESGKAQVSVNGNRWISSHGSDTGIGKANANGRGGNGDAFDLFVWYEHDSDFNAALRAAGAMFTVNGQTITQANQTAYITRPANQTASQPVGELPITTTTPDDLESAQLAFDIPTFDDSHFYGIAGDVAKLASKHSEADPVAVYVSFLTAAAAILGNSKYILVGDSRHYARVFSALVGASSRARKGTSFQPVKRIIRKTEELYLKHNKQPLYIDSLHIADGGLSSAEGLIFAVRDESEETNAKGHPLHDAVNDKRLLVVEEELGSVFKVMQREGNTLSPVLRKAWDGGTLAPLTKSNRLKATDPHINALGHITQFELKALVSDSDMYNGSVNRFLWAYVRRTKKMAYPNPIDDDAVYQIAIRLSDAMIKSEEEQVVALNADARQFWDVQYHKISADKPGLLGCITARSEAHVLRLSLLFCLLDGLSEIEQRHIKAAIDLVEFCNRSVEFIFSTPADDAGSDGDKVLSALSSAPMSQTEISNLFNGHKKRRDLMTLLTELQIANKIKQTKEPGPRKKIVWSLI